MERSLWTDERMDDAVAGLQREMELTREEFRHEMALFREEMREFREELREMREEMRDFRREMREEIRALRVDFSALQRQLAQIGWGVAAALIVALVALAAAAI